MPLCSAAPVHVSDKDRRALEALVRKHHTPQGLVMRAQIILLAARGVGVRPTVARLGVGRATVQRWRRLERAPVGEQRHQGAQHQPRRLGASNLVADRSEIYVVEEPADENHHQEQ